jgi:hypothetical protein
LDKSGALNLTGLQDLSGFTSKNNRGLEKEEVGALLIKLRTDTSVCPYNTIILKKNGKGA